MDTYVERDAVSYLMSGTIFSATFAGSMNLSKYHKKEITKQQMIQDTTKLAVQGGIGTGSAVAATNCIGRGDYLNAMLIVGLGAIGVYGTEKISQMIENNTKEPKLSKHRKIINNNKDNELQND
jgi:hypothetical protein